FILLKPNITTPTDTTYKGYDELIYAGLMRGQGPSGGRAGISLDGSFVNAIVMGVRAVDMDDATPIAAAGYGIGLANDTGRLDYASGFLGLGLGFRDTSREAFHWED